MACNPNEVIAALEEIAPPELADSWDNAGLLIQGPSSEQVERILVCHDFTGPVLSEARRLKATFIVSYHPLFLDPPRRFLRGERVGRMIMEAARAGLHIYSPHTALDAVHGGAADWLAGILGELSSCRPIQPAQGFDPSKYGQGRIAALKEPVSIEALVERIEKGLGLSRIQVVLPEEGRDKKKSIETIALCPGAGASLFEEDLGVDLYFTGEMSHHRVLDLQARGVHVVLAGHAGTEVGFLPILRDRLARRLGSLVEVFLYVSK